MTYNISVRSGCRTVNDMVCLEETKKKVPKGAVEISVLRSSNTSHSLVAIYALKDRYYVTQAYQDNSGGVSAKLVLRGKADEVIIKLSQNLKE
jgi:hypothetical protein